MLCGHSTSDLPLENILRCVCKDHLHARWAINALIKLAKKHQMPIALDFTTYETFFSKVLYSSECTLNEDASEYIKWGCTPSKDDVCSDIRKFFESFKVKICSVGKDEVTVKMLHFVKREEKTKKGKQIKRLKAQPVQANINWVVDFIEKMLTKIIHHRNLLRNFRTNIDTVLNVIEKVAEIGLDFSENVTIPVNKEPQSLHWAGCKEVKTVHSGLTKCNGNKTYHPYISDDLTHDQAFVKVVMMEILDEIDIKPEDEIVASSDNCTSQYKSAQHFNDLRSFTDKYQIDII